MRQKKITREKRSKTKTEIQIKLFIQNQKASKSQTEILENVCMDI